MMENGTIYGVSGRKTMRFSNLDILKNVEGVFMQLESELPYPL